MSGADMYADVRSFHEKFGCAMQDHPAEPDGRTVELRATLMREELSETLDAMLRGDLPEIADGLADLVYVALGTAVAYGIDLRPVWRMVHAANMAKVGGGRRADGKITKPEGWQAPDVAGEVERQRLAGRVG